MFSLANEDERLNVGNLDVLIGNTPHLELRVVTQLVPSWKYHLTRLD